MDTAGEVWVVGGVRVGGGGAGRDGKRIGGGGEGLGSGGAEGKKDERVG